VHALPRGSEGFSPAASGGPSREPRRRGGGEAETSSHDLLYRKCTFVQCCPIFQRRRNHIFHRLQPPQLVVLQPPGAKTCKSFRIVSESLHNSRLQEGGCLPQVSVGNMLWTPASQTLQGDAKAQLKPKSPRLSSLPDKAPAASKSQGGGEVRPTLRRRWRRRNWRHGYRYRIYYSLASDALKHRNQRVGRRPDSIGLRAKRCRLIDKSLADARCL